MLMLIEQHQLVKKDRTECQQLAAVQAFDWHLAVPLKDPWLILGFEDMLPAVIKCPGVTPTRLDRVA